MPSRDLKLRDLDFAIENYDTPILEAVYADIGEVSEMTCEESRFLNGLVRYFKPKKMLEVGIAAGSSSCVLLNAIKDMPETVLHSVDLSEKYYRNSSLLSGWKAQELFPANPQWNLHLGADVAEVIENQIEGGIDFLLLDTAHVHPAETLSFLSVFPYLSEDAVVALHDVNLFTDLDNANAYATKLLLDSVVADKITPKEFQDGYLHPNIAAFQINGDTRKYIADVVRSLFFPWKMKVPEKILLATEKVIREKYPPELLDLYLKSVKQNQNLYRRSVALNKVKTVVTFGARWAKLRAACIMCLPASWVVFLKRVRKYFTGK